ncbi:hypothetical protein M9Y10_010172 [Tritrichomonas musculus]|uniref:Macro domain-containing protein n=1 Tax=Tritrichomonas musculus TaxID=1915356 RepID=A0ABR2IRD8_9EUKA
MTKSECFSCRDWFNEIFGFWESVKNVGDNFDVEPSKDCVYLYSKKNKKKFNAGLFQIKSSDRSTFKLSESRNNGKLHIIHGHGNYSKCYGLVDILSMQSLSKWDGATYLAASNFNCLEFVSSHSTASSGVTSYYADPTQGPYAALACGPAIVYRNYFVKHHGVVGQLDKEIELLEKARIPVRHGYAIIKNDTALSHFKKDPNSEQKSKNLNSIQIQNEALKKLPDSEAQVKSESRKELKSDPNSNSKTTDKMNSQLNEKEQVKKSAARRGSTRSKLKKFKPNTTYNLDGSKSSLNKEPPKPELHKEQRSKTSLDKEHSKTDSDENHVKKVANEKCLKNDSDKEQRLKISTNKEHSKTDSDKNHDKKVANEKCLKNDSDKEQRLKISTNKEHSKTDSDENHVKKVANEKCLKNDSDKEQRLKISTNKEHSKTDSDENHVKKVANEKCLKNDSDKEQRLKSRTNKEHSKTDSDENHDKKVANEKCLKSDSDKEQRLKISTNKEHSKTDSDENHDKKVANEKCLKNDSDKEQRLKSSTNKEHSKTDSDEVQVEKCREDKRTKHPDSNRNQAGLLSIKSSCEKSLIKNSEQKQSKLPDSAATSMQQGIAAQHAMPSPPDKEQDKPDTSFDPDDPSIWQVGSHRNCEIVMTRGPNRNFKRAPPDRIANHVYAAAFNFASDVIRTPLTKEVSMKLLTGEYRATILTAWENSIIFNKRAGARKLSLTLLGGGVFANPFDLICNAIKENVDLIVESGLDVYITCYNDDVYRNVDYYLGAVVKKTGGKVYDTNNFNECRELLD